MDSAQLDEKTKKNPGLDRIKYLNLMVHHGTKHKIQKITVFPLTQSNIAHFVSSKRILIFNKICRN